MATNKIINEPERVVVDMLEGIVAVHPHLQLLDGLPDVSVLARGFAGRLERNKVVHFKWLSPQLNIALAMCRLKSSSRPPCRRAPWQSSLVRSPAR